MRPAIHLAKEVGTRLGLREILLGCLSLAWGAGALGAQSRTPDAAVAELLAADRAFAAASARTTMLDGLVGMMADDVIVPAPGRGLVTGPAAVRAEFARDTLAPTTRAEWTPVRGGISADARHGFTFGVLTLHRADGRTVPGKYLAYWVKGADGWRVAAYKRTRRPEGPFVAERAPAVPAALVAPTGDAGAIAAHRASLMQAERDFAAEAQVVGLKAAFAKHGSADAMNLGGPANSDFVIGADAIAALVAQGVPEGTSHLDWGPDTALVSSSGDLGVTFGFITPNAAPPGGGAKPRIPFFTVWRRAGPGAPWLYVAE